MKKLLFLSAALGIGASAFAKHVDVETAKKVGYQFLKTNAKDLAVKEAGSLELSYTSVSGGTECYYVFNSGSQGFVMVSADDNVTPVFGYSTESTFGTTDVPSHVAYWLQNYTDQVKYVIDNNIPATEAIAYDWASLLEDGNTQLKTTAGTPGVPLLVTTWNQNPRYNEMCPSDNGGLSVTGCVATAMAQIMKYWNYPAQGSGSYSYDVQGSQIGVVSANFGATTYKWGNMTNALGSTSPQAAIDAVAELNYHAGVSVEMMYSSNSSGSYSWLVPDALQQYFNYASSVEYIRRDDYSETEWISKLKKEIDELRPVYYSGSGSGGGHAWVADGYDNNSFFHINWGWGGTSNGYFKHNAMNPSSLGTGGGTGGFNNNQAAIIGIKPQNMGTPDKYENNNNKEAAYTFSLSFSGNTASIKTDNASLHTTNDGDFFKIFLPMGDNYSISGRVHDKANSGNGTIYTADVDFGLSKTGVTFSPITDDVMAANFDVTGGGDIWIRVRNKNAGTMGTYMLDLTVTKQTTGIKEIGRNDGIIIYPNPASNQLNITLNGATAEITLIDMQGRKVQSLNTSNQQTATLQTANISNGLYFVQIKTENGTVTQKVAIEK